MDEILGAGQGAAVGAAVGGPVGAVVGGVLGFVGGLFGSKAKRAKKRATREAQRMAEREAAVQRRDIVRQLRFARAQAVAAGSSESGGLQSSAVQGSIGSISSQGLFNLGFFDTQAASQGYINSQIGRADKYAGYAGAVNSILSIGSSLYDYGLVGKPKTPTNTNGGGGGSTPGTTGYPGPS